MSGSVHRSGDSRLRRQMYQGGRVRVPVDEVVHLGSRRDVQAFECMVGNVLLQPAQILCCTTADRLSTPTVYAGHLRHVMHERRPDEPR